MVWWPKWQNLISILDSPTKETTASGKPKTLAKSRFLLVIAILHDSEIEADSDLELLKTDGYEDDNLSIGEPDSHNGRSIQMMEQARLEV